MNSIEDRRFPMFTANDAVTELFPSSRMAQAAVAPCAGEHSSGRTQRMAALGQCLMQRMETPLFLTDALGAVLEANPAATRRFEKHEGLWLDAGGRVAVRQKGRWVPLSRWHGELSVGGEVTLALEVEGAVPMQLVLRNMAAGEYGAGQPGWVMACVEAVRMNRGEAMRRRFHFTLTQARLAEMLCQGMRPTHAAQLLGVKISTVRTHVGQMYEKTGTHSQAQLVALLSHA